jgi:hypothetical protein
VPTVYAVLVLMPRQDGSFLSNLEGIWQEKEEAIAYANELFDRFDGFITVKVLAAEMNKSFSVGHVFSRPATIPAGQDRR